MYSHYIKQADTSATPSNAVPLASKQVVESLLQGAAPTGQLYSGLGLGALGALLGAGIGGVTAEKGKRIRNALIGAGIGGAAGGAGGYLLSPHIKPMNQSYLDADRNTALNAVKTYWDPSTPTLLENRPISLAELLGLLGNPALHEALNRKN